MSILARVVGHAVPLPAELDLPDGSLVRIEPCETAESGPEDFIRRTNEAYTPEVCEETLRVNESLPIDEA